MDTIAILAPLSASEQRVQNAVNVAEGIALRLRLMRSYLHEEKYDLAKATLADVRKMLPRLDEDELFKSKRGPALAKNILHLHSHLVRRLEVEPGMEF